MLSSVSSTRPLIYTDTGRFEIKVSFDVRSTPTSVLVGWGRDLVICFNSLSRKKNQIVSNICSHRRKSSLGETLDLHITMEQKI